MSPTCASNPPMPRSSREKLGEKSCEPRWAAPPPGPLLIPLLIFRMLPFTATTDTWHAGPSKPISPVRITWPPDHSLRTSSEPADAPSGGCSLNVRTLLTVSIRLRPRISQTTCCPTVRTCPLNTRRTCSETTSAGSASLAVARPAKSTASSSEAAWILVGGSATGRAAWTSSPDDTFRLLRCALFNAMCPSATASLADAVSMKPFSCTKRADCDAKKRIRSAGFSKT